MVACAIRAHRRVLWLGCEKEGPSCIRRYAPFRLIARNKRDDATSVSQTWLIECSRHTAQSPYRLGVRAFFALDWHLRKGIGASRPYRIRRPSCIRVACVASARQPMKKPGLTARAFLLMAATTALRKEWRLHRRCSVSHALAFVTAHCVPLSLRYPWRPRLSHRSHLGHQACAYHQR